MEKKSLSDVLKNINKKYGKETASTVDKKENTIVETFSTDCYSFDRVFGVDGIPKGRILDLYGEFSAGKSTIAMYIVAQIQKKGGTAVWIDAESCFTSEYAKKLGIDTSKLILIQPTVGEEALNILEEFVNSGIVDIIVVDSTAALVPEKELEGKIEDHNIALQARIIGKALRMITAPAAKNKTTVLFISQLRQRIGMFVGGSTAPTGGKALSFYASVRLKVSKIKTLKGKGDEVIGNRLKICAEKNKVGKPFRTAEVDLIFEKGIDTTADIFDIGVKNNIISKSGNTYSFGEIRLGVGRDNAKEVLEKDKKMLEEIKKILK